MARENALLTVAQAAKRLGVSPNTIRAWADRGAIPVVRLPSGHRRFEAHSIDGLRESNPPDFDRVRYGSEDPDWRRHLEERVAAIDWDAARENAEAMNRLAEEIAARHPRGSDWNSVEIIRQMREDRTHELMRAWGWE